MILRLLVLAAVFIAGTGAAPASEEAFAHLRKGGIGIMRHALAPGVGDPPGFDLADCATQRNLSEEGRQQARRAGEMLRGRGITAARVFTSRWCRARETAELLGLGPVEALPALDSFFGDRSSAPEQTASLNAFMAGVPRDRPVILVTHQVNITDLLGLVPASGEMAVIEPGQGRPAVIGRIQF